jgi:hypothetical protein
MAVTPTAQIGRATPANPMPGVSTDASIPSTAGRNLPPELGTGAIAILEGRTFMYSDSVGDVPGGSIGGLVHADTRFLNEVGATVNGKRFWPCVPAASTTTRPSSSWPATRCRG